MLSPSKAVLRLGLRAVKPLAFSAVALFVVYSSLLAIFFPLYTRPPLRYTDQRTLSEGLRTTGLLNPTNKKVYIAANIIDAQLIRDSWGPSLKELVTLLGPANVFVSIYENDSGDETKQALTTLREELPCDKSIVTGAHLDGDHLHHVQRPDGTYGVKRIEYLAEVRNLALLPLEPDRAIRNSKATTGFKQTNTTFDYLLFLNDIYFDPVEATQLIFNTNQDDQGTPQYEAACAVDFMSITNFYDNYASRDTDGYGLGYGPGFRLFPWYAPYGSARSRKAVLSGSDAVPVKSCWGGMIAFQADWFQTRDKDVHDLSQAGRDQLPMLRFRSETELYWDASECCLIHADISKWHRSLGPGVSDSGIYQNPYVRVAYKSGTFRWLWIIARIEHGFSPLQYLLTVLTPYPKSSERRTDEPGNTVYQTIWEYNKGFRTERREAPAGGFCGIREMVVMKDDPAKAREEGERPYDSFLPP